MKLGNKIKKIRELKGIQPKEIANFLKVTPQAYGKIERDETNVNDEKLEKIAQFFKLTADDIRNFDESIYFTNITNSKVFGVNNTYQENSDKEIISSFITLTKEVTTLIQNQNKLLETIVQLIPKK